MAKKENANSVEDYRKERKERLAQAAKKNAKKNKKLGGSSVGKVIQKIVAVVVVLAIVAGIGYFAVSRSGLLSKFDVALTIGNDEITSVEYGYLYYQRYMEFVSQAQQYEQYYGYNVMGLDSTTYPDEQDSPYSDDEENTLKWDKYIEQATTKWVNEFLVLYKEAVANGYTVSEDDQAEIDSTLTEMRSTAAENNLSLNAYLRMNYASGINESFFKKYLAMEKIVSAYSEAKQQEISDGYTDEVLNKEYAEAPDDYDVVSLRIYSVTKETLEAEEGETEEALAKRQETANAAAKAEAQAVYDATTDTTTFLAAAKTNHKVTEGETYDADSSTEQYRINKETLTSTINEEAATWAFADGRAVADKAMYETDSGYYVVLVIETQYPTQAINVRHILISFKEDTSDTTEATDEEVAAAKTKADEIYKEWLNGEKTEDSFAALATENSTDTGSSENGGLYEDVTPGSMVAEFDNWCFNRARKAGDSGIVKTTYGYHIMFFSSRSDDYIWRTTLRDTHTQDDYSTYFEEAVAKDEYKLIEDAECITKGSKIGLEIVKAYIDNSNSQSSQY